MAGPLAAQCSHVHQMRSTGRRAVGGGSLGQGRAGAPRSVLAPRTPASAPRHAEACPAATGPSLQIMRGMDSSNVGVFLRPMSREERRAFAK